MRWFEEHGEYRVSWGADGVYTAWHRARWYAFEWAPIAYYRPGDIPGSNEVRHAAARAACRAHWAQQQGVALGA